MTKQSESIYLSAAKKTMLVATALHQNKLVTNTASPADADELLNQLLNKCMIMDISEDDGFVTAWEQCDYLHDVRRVMEGYYEDFTDKKHYMIFTEVSFSDCLSWLTDVQKFDRISGESLLVLTHKKMSKLLDKAVPGLECLDGLNVGDILSLSADGDGTNVTICRLS